MTDTTDTTETFDHDAWRTLLSTGVGYGVVLLAMFLLLFVAPFLLFLAL